MTISLYDWYYREMKNQKLQILFFDFLFFGFKNQALFLIIKILKSNEFFFGFLFFITLWGWLLENREIDFCKMWLCAVAVLLYSKRFCRGDQFGRALYYGFFARSEVPDLSSSSAVNRSIICLPLHTWDDKRRAVDRPSHTSHICYAYLCNKTDRSSYGLFP